MTPTEQAADRVKALVDQLRIGADDWGADQLMDQAADALTALQARVGELEGVLKPFAAEADTWSGDALENLLPVYVAQSKDGSTFKATFSLADIARARALLTPPLEQE